jgi:hypothetical protein
MKARYIAVYKLHGANKLSEDANEFRLAALTSPALSAMLTADPESYFLHIDRWAALASQLFKGLFDPQQQGGSSTRCKPRAGNRPRKEEAIMRAGPSRQRDLFEEDQAAAEVPTGVRATLIGLIEELLVEAITDGSVEPRVDGNAVREAGHEQDHA